MPTLNMSRKESNNSNQVNTRKSTIATIRHKVLFNRFASFAVSLTD